MKQLALCLIIFLLFGAAFGQRRGSGKNQPTAVTVYEDGKKQSVMTFSGDLLVKESTNAGKTNDVIRYYYAKNGKIDRTEEWKNGVKLRRRDRDYEFEVDLVAEYLYSVDLLKKKGIKIPLPGLIFSQIKDTAAVFDAANGEDVKNETSSSGEFKTIKFPDFNKRIRFDPTLLEINMDQTITDYELILKNGEFFKEIFKTGESESGGVISSEITREFAYDKHRLTKLLTTVNSMTKEGKPYNSVVELKFVYAK